MVFLCGLVSVIFCMGFYPISVFVRFVWSKTTLAFRKRKGTFKSLFHVKGISNPPKIKQCPHLFTFRLFVESNLGCLYNSSCWQNSKKALLKKMSFKICESVTYSINWTHFQTENIYIFNITCAMLFFDFVDSLPNHSLTRFDLSWDVALKGSRLCKHQIPNQPTEPTFLLVPKTVTAFQEKGF